jgi:hypothetical protein
MNRKLSDTERVVWLVERTSPLNSGAVVRVNGLLEEHVLRFALNLLQKRHSMLRTRIDIPGGIAPLTDEADGVPPIPLRVEARIGDAHWRAEANAELKTPLPLARVPLLRVVLLQSDAVSEIVVTLHHVMNDSASALYITRDLLVLVAQIVKGEKNPNLRIYPERRALDEAPCNTAKIMDNLLHMTAQLASQISEALAPKPEEPLPAASQPARPALTQPGDSVHHNGYARLLHYVLSAEETRALIERCREENTTVHGAMVAAVMQAAGRHMAAAPAARPSRVRCISSNRMRGSVSRYDAATSDEIGLFVLHTLTPRRAGESCRFWDTAREAETPVPEALRDGEVMVSLPLPRELARRLSQPYSRAIMVSSLGHEAAPQRYRSIVVQEGRAKDPFHGMADCFGMVVNRLPNRFMLSFFYPESALAEDRVGLMGAVVIKALRAVLASE